MNRVAVYLLRFAVILAGYAAAALAGAAFIELLVVSRLDPAVENGVEAYRGAIYAIPLIALIVGYVAFLPAVLVIVAAELLGRRDWLFHTLGGGMVAIASLAIHFGLAGAESASRESGPTLSLIAAGMASGFAYWLIAGRSAGAWRTRLAADPASPAA